MPIIPIAYAPPPATQIERVVVDERVAGFSSTSNSLTSFVSFGNVQTFYMVEEFESPESELVTESASFMDAFAWLEGDEAHSSQTNTLIDEAMSKLPGERTLL